MRRSGQAGLWLSACGRFTVRRLGNNSWIVSPLSSPDGGGPYSSWLGAKLLAQRFPTKTQAAEALEVTFQMSAKLHKPVAMKWVQLQPGYWMSQYQDVVVLAQRSGQIWRVTSMPEDAYQLKLQYEALDADDASTKNEAFNLKWVVQRKTGILGTTRTLAEAKEMTSQEMAWI